jgi:hypothetical protein
MAFSGQVHDAVGPELLESLLHRSLVADIRVQELVTGRAVNVAKGRQIAGVGKSVDVEDFITPLENEVAD